MKVLVTGGAGFIGSHVVDALLRDGDEVWVVDDLSNGRKQNLSPGATFSQLDVRSSQFARQLVEYRPDAIAHFAAQMDVRKSVADPYLDADINVMGMVRLLQASSQAQVGRVLFASSGGAIYGEQELFPAPESHPCRPTSAYGVSKFCAESYLDLFQRMGVLSTISLRFANVYGPRQDSHGEAGVVAIFIDQMLSGQAPCINGDGLQSRDFVHVEDVCRAVLSALRGTGTGAINIGTGKETDINTLASLLAKHMGYAQELKHGPPKPGEQLRSSIDPGRAAKDLAWRPMLDLDRGLRQTVRYYRQLRSS